MTTFGTIERMGFEKNRRIVKVMGNKPVNAMVGGKKCYFRSTLEYKWARYLQMLKETKQIKHWQYEPSTFYFANVKTAPVQYTPDFLVTENDGNFFYQETKGHHDGQINTKLRRMQEQFPFVRIQLVLENQPKRGKGVNRIETAKKYADRVFFASDIFRQTKGIVNYNVPVIQGM